MTQPSLRRLPAVGVLAGVVAGLADAVAAVFRDGPMGRTPDFLEAALHLVAFWMPLGWCAGLALGLGVYLWRRTPWSRAARARTGSWARLWAADPSAFAGTLAVSAGGADYRYVEDPDSKTDPKIMDFTKKLHAEVAPSITFTIPKSLIGGQYLSIGVAYRLSYGSLTRQKGNPEDPQTIDINATGLNFGGFTVGLQYAPVPEFQIGLVYRHGIRVALEGTKGSINPGVLVEGDVTAEIVAPGMFGVGVRGNFGAVSLMLDFEYELNSLSDVSVLTITDPSQTWLKPSTVELEGRTYEFGEGVLPLFATYFWRDSINSRGERCSGVAGRGPALRPRHRPVRGARRRVDVRHGHGALRGAPRG